MFTCFTGKVSKKDLFPQSKNGDFGRGSSELDRPSSNDYRSALPEPIKLYEDQSSAQAEMDALRTYERQRQEDEEKRRVIEELAKERSPAIPTATVSNVEKATTYPDKRKSNAGLHFIKELAQSPAHR